MIEGSTKGESDIPLYLFTYNCNKRVIDANVFKSKVSQSLPPKDNPSHLYVFALQEFCTILDGSFKASANQQLIAYNELLQVMLFEEYGTDHFQTIAINHTGAVGLIIITPYPLKFQNVRLANTSCGYGYSSMKGGVGVRLRYYPEGKYGDNSVELSFAGIHLNAYEGEYYYLQRNANLLRIVRSLDFGDGYGLIKPNNHVFILGDLNYRTTKEYKKTSVVAQNLLSLADQHSEVDTEYVNQLFVQYDELHNALKNGEVLFGFSEGKIDFKPSYKYYLNTGIYNSKRCPSWCDRILFLSTYETTGNDDLGLQLLRAKGKDSKQKNEGLPVVGKYDCIDELLLSDHRPVFAHIDIPFAPPKLIISPMSGCLEIVSTGLTLDESFSGFEQLQGIDNNTHIESGPTAIYLKPTKLDLLIHTLVTPFMDTTIGYGLWFGTTSEGRLVLLIFALLCFSLWYLF